MKNILICFIFVFSFLLAMPAKAVKPILESESTTLVINNDLDESTFSSRIGERIHSNSLFDILKPKKKKRKKKKKKRLKRSRLKTYLYGYILSGVGAGLAYVLGYALLILSFAELGFLLGALVIIGAFLLAITSGVFFILWMIELTRRLDDLE